MQLVYGMTITQTLLTNIIVTISDCETRSTSMTLNSIHNALKLTEEHSLRVNSADYRATCEFRGCK